MGGWGNQKGRNNDRKKGDNNFYVNENNQIVINVRKVYQTKKIKLQHSGPRKTRMDRKTGPHTEFDRRAELNSGTFSQKLCTKDRWATWLKTGMLVTTQFISPLIQLCVRNVTLGRDHVLRNQVGGCGNQ